MNVAQGPGSVPGSGPKSTIYTQMGLGGILQCPCSGSMSCARAGADAAWGRLGGRGLRLPQGRLALQSQVLGEQHA